LHLILAGLSHHSAPIEVRERLSLAEHELPHALEALRACRDVREAVILSTCNRMELYVVFEGDATQAESTVHRHLALFHNVPEWEFAPHLYFRSGQACVQHLLRVASGLDSLVLGEAQILGQVRSALRAGQQAESAGSVLNGLFQQALTTGKRTQSETGLSRGAFSIGHAAVDLARSIFDDLTRATVLILGAGKMSELTARHLRQSGVQFVMVANRTYDKAARVAAQLGGQAIHYETFPDALLQSDIVIASTAAPHPILKREMLLPVLKKRRGKPLFLIDIAVPRDIAPDVGDLENVFLFNIDDLQTVVEEDARTRGEEARIAEGIVAEETERFLAWLRTREATPVIEAMTAKLERIRQEEFAVLRQKLGNLSEREWQAIEAATRAMMRKAGRDPLLRLKREQEERRGETQYDLLQAAQELFALGDSPPTSDSSLNAEERLPREEVMP
jgi:glutamyl-tRNA reductase